MKDDDETKFAQGYERRWDSTLGFGQQGQLIAFKLISDIAAQKIHVEYKRDDRYRETGNLFVELTQDKGGRGRNWKPSGLLGTEAPYQVFLINELEAEQTVLIYPTSWIHRAVEFASYLDRGFDNFGFCIRDPKTHSWGVTLSPAHIAKTRNPNGPEMHEHRKRVKKALRL